MWYCETSILSHPLETRLALNFHINHPYWHNPHVCAHTIHAKIEHTFTPLGCWSLTPTADHYVRERLHSQTMHQIHYLTRFSTVDFPPNKYALVFSQRLTECWSWIKLKFYISTSNHKNVRGNRGWRDWSNAMPNRKWMCLMLLVYFEFLQLLTVKPEEHTEFPHRTDSLLVHLWACSSSKYPKCCAFDIFFLNSGAEFSVANLNFTRIIPFDFSHYLACTAKQLVS